MLFYKLLKMTMFFIAKRLPDIHTSYIGAMGFVMFDE